MKDFDLSSIQATASGMDAFFESEPTFVTPHVAQTSPLTPEAPVAKQASAEGRIKVASLSQLSGFVRTASDQLVHRTNQELWSLQKDARGDYYVERMFDANKGPIKG